MVQFVWNRAMNIFMFIVLYELKALYLLVPLIFTNIFLLKLMALKVTPVNLMKPRLLTYLYRLTWYLPVFQADTNYYNFLLSSMIVLRIITSNVDVFVTSECIHLYILCIVP